MRPIQYPQRTLGEFARSAEFYTPYEATPDPRGFFEAMLGFDGMAGKWVRIPALVQRRYFGNVPFGKRAIRLSENGEVEVFKSQAFGKDFDIWKFRFDLSSKTWRNSCDDTLAWLPCKH